MKKIIVLLLCFFISGCTLLNRADTIAIAPHIDRFEYDTFSILPFDLLNKGLNRQLGFDVGEVMTDAFETALLKNGYKVVERNRINSVTQEMKFSYSGNVDPEQLKEIGKLTNSDVIILGMVRAFKPPVFGNSEKPGKATQCTTISFSVKAIHLGTGEILWKGTMTKSSGFKDDFLYSCDYDILKYSDKVSRDMVKKIKGEVDKASSKSEIDQ